MSRSGEEEPWDLILQDCKIKVRKNVRSENINNDFHDEKYFRLMDQKGISVGGKTGSV